MKLLEVRKITEVYKNGMFISCWYWSRFRILP